MSGMSRADEIMAKLGKAKVIQQFKIQIRFSVFNLLHDVNVCCCIINFIIKGKEDSHKLELGRWRAYVRDEPGIFLPYQVSLVATRSESEFTLVSRSLVIRIQK